MLEHIVFGCSKLDPSAGPGDLRRDPAYFGSQVGMALMED